MQALIKTSSQNPTADDINPAISHNTIIPIVRVLKVMQDVYIINPSSPREALENKPHNTFKKPQTRALCENRLESPSPKGPK